jgi:phage FluMu protein Com
VDKINEIKKDVRCPNCMKIVSVSGNVGDTLKVTCPACGAIG